MVALLDDVVALAFGTSFDPVRAIVSQVWPCQSVGLDGFDHNFGTKVSHRVDADKNGLAILGVIDDLKRVVLRLECVHVRQSNVFVRPVEMRVRCGKKDA